MEAEVRAWLAEVGFEEDIKLDEMSGGLGSTRMWSFVAEAGASPLVVRMFGQGKGGPSAREAAAMKAAAEHGVPVPELVAEGTIAGCPVLLTTFVDGVNAAQAILAAPDGVEEIGRAIGATLGAINRIEAPALLRERPHAWIDRGGPALGPIRSMLEAVPGQDRLLHLDLHVLNVLVEDGRLTGVVDWENTLAGPPHMDLARSRAILRSARLMDVAATIDAAVFDALERGIVAGHTEVVGPDPHPELSLAWGFAMTVADQETHIGKPDSGITAELVGRLAEERDRLIRGLLK